jgi:hypothetical protein
MYPKAAIPTITARMVASIRKTRRTLCFLVCFIHGSLLDANGRDEERPLGRLFRFKC